MNTLAQLKNRWIPVGLTRHWSPPQSLLTTIVMDCVRMAAVVAFAAIATLLIGG
jgi:hypothetical protein